VTCFFVFCISSLVSLFSTFFSSHLCVHYCQLFQQMFTIGSLNHTTHILYNNGVSLWIYIIWDSDVTSYVLFFIPFDFLEKKSVDHPKLTKEENSNLSKGDNVEFRKLGINCSSDCTRLYPPSSSINQSATLFHFNYNSKYKSNQLIPFTQLLTLLFYFPYSFCF
jgi:hypothetical protein